ncbi:MAG: hypothetical protein BYD32DRAFT_457998 [Podila humilis]|nr:MAG: hypothetical protein BYD32DRAFT_457998 [Podila humilis]
MLKYPHSTVRNIVNTFFDTDRIHKLPRGNCCNVKLQVEHLDWLTDKLDEFAGRPVAMLTQELNEHFEFDPPITEHAVDKALNKHTTYTLKLMWAEPECYNNPEYINGRRQWAQQVLNGPGNMNHFVYIDEAGFNLHITCKYGCAPRGRRAFQVVPYNHGPNQSLVIAIDSTGILAWHFKPRAYSQVTFTKFLEEKLFLPHLNAAELVFSSVKTHVRKEVIEELTLTGHVRAGLEHITDVIARGWIREVARNFEYALQGVPLGRLYNTRNPFLMNTKTPIGPHNVAYQVISHVHLGKLLPSWEFQYLYHTWKDAYQNMKVEMDSENGLFGLKHSEKMNLQSKPYLSICTFQTILDTVSGDHDSILTTLELSGNKFGSNGAQALAEALKKNPTLTTLHLYTNGIGDNGAQALSEALNPNSTLTTLNLPYNLIRGNGAQALSEALKTNSTLTTLDLHNNGAQGLSEALKTSSTLTTLNVYNNKIGDNGFQALNQLSKIIRCYQ